MILIVANLLQTFQYDQDFAPLQHYTLRISAQVSPNSPSFREHPKSPMAVLARFEGDIHDSNTPHWVRSFNLGTRAVQLPRSGLMEFVRAFERKASDLVCSIHIHPGLCSSHMDTGQVVLRVYAVDGTCGKLKLQMCV